MNATGLHRDHEMENLLGRLYDKQGWDFRNYKSASLSRRLTKRLNTLNISSYNEYSAFLDADPSEYEKLLSFLTIKVSEFFREPEVFEALCNIIHSSGGGGLHNGLRIWSCGCANGEEPYSLAMYLSECLHEGALKKSKVFATDIDAEAIDNARRAAYKEDSIANVDLRLREKYFFREHGAYKVKYSVRNIVKFGRHDIVKDYALTNIDVLFCRNLFIYFKKGLQEDAFKKLDYALKPGGILVMGRSEAVPASFLLKYKLLAKNTSIYRKNT